MPRRISAPPSRRTSPRNANTHGSSNNGSCGLPKRRFMATVITLTSLVMGLVFQGRLLALVTKNTFPGSSERISGAGSIISDEEMAIAPVLSRLLQEEEEQAKLKADLSEFIKDSNASDREWQQQMETEQGQHQPLHKAEVASGHQDKDCPFRFSPMYRSIYVYPNPGDQDWTGEILSGHNNNPIWPWIEIQSKTKHDASVHYNPKRPYIQYNSELLVQLLLTHPDSCLRSYDPDTAKLFYVPYMPSLEYHNGTLGLGSYETSPFGKALMSAIDHQNYTLWETTFGLTSKYWKRRDGADHILVFSEPLHGLFHPKSRRGNFHYINTQKQLASPIVMSVELSTTFVKEFPKCARKNILLPYPNTDGQWFNYEFDDMYGIDKKKNDTAISSKSKLATLAAERQLLEEDQTLSINSAVLNPRTHAQFYSAGNHGSCQKLRKTLNQDYKCSASFKATKNDKYEQGYRRATFCPCPGGDSPSAKRMFDALHAGCIPIILSEDFVWPWTKEFDTIKEEDEGTNDQPSSSSSLSLLDPNNYSIRVTAKDFDQPKRDSATCQLLNASEPDLQ